MIVNHQEKIIIFSPTKTGTESLLRTLKARSAGSHFEFILPKHSMRTSHRDYRGFIIVRDPYTRLESIYKHLRRDGAVRKLGIEAAEGWEHFIDAFLHSWRTRPVHDWSHNQTELYKKANSCLDSELVAVRLDRIDSFLAYLRRETGVDIPEMVHIHKTKDYGDIEWTDGIRNAVNAWAVPDCESFKYHWIGRLPFPTKQDLGFGVGPEAIIKDKTKKILW